jgi:hypothetical protein
LLPFAQDFFQLLQRLPAHRFGDVGEAFGPGGVCFRAAQQPNAFPQQPAQFGQLQQVQQRLSLVGGEAELRRIPRPQRPHGLP